MEVTAAKATGKGFTSFSLALIYSTWPNVREHRPLIWAFCGWCWQEKLVHDVFVVIAERQRVPIQCDDCLEQSERQKIWNPLWRC